MLLHKVSTPETEEELLIANLYDCSESKPYSHLEAFKFLSFVML